MNEENVKKIAQKIYDQNATSGQFSVSYTSFHTHNGTDSQRIKQKDIINGNNSIISATTTTTETDIINLVQNVTNLTIHAIAFGNTITEFYLTGALLAGSTSATLTSVWLYTTGTHLVTFSDNETKTVTFTHGSTAITWTGGLSGGASAIIEVAIITKKAIIHGNAQLGDSYLYNWAGNVTTIPIQKGFREPFLQSCGYTYIDTENLAYLKVGVNGDSATSSVYYRGYLALANDETGTTVASIQITKWTNKSIILNTYLAANWNISWYLSMS